MSKLFKLRISFILLIVGISFIPTAFLAKGYMIDQVPANTGTTLLTIKNGALNYIEQEFKGLGIPEILPQIIKEEISDFEEDLARVYPIPVILQFVKNEVLSAFPLIINSSKAAREIFTAIDLVKNQTSLSFARLQFFNNVTFQDEYSTSIEGISEHMNGGTINLNFSAYARSRLLNGYTYNDTQYPGLITNTNYGFGVTDWLEFYSLAESEPIDGPNRTLIQIVYNCTWESGQLQNVSAYIKSYLWNVIVKDFYDSKGVVDRAEFEFMGQWANSSLFTSRINLDYFSEIISEHILGLEAGNPDPTNISLSTARDLWDPTNISSFLNDTGILKWYQARYEESNLTTIELGNTFKISTTQVGMVESWLFSSVKNDVVPIIIEYPEPYGLNTTTDALAELLLYDQWANGTHVPDGIKLENDYKGFEVGIPTKTNITYNTVSDLFDVQNRSSFINKKGIFLWVEAAEGSISARDELISLFSLNELQLNLTLDWLFTTLRYNIVPNLLVKYTRLAGFVIRISQLCEYNFYRQWANGTIFKDGIDAGPLLSLETPVKNFEIGIPTPTYLNYSQTELLWDETNSYTFDNRKGIIHWFEALKSTEQYNAIRSYFSLSIDLMDNILDWLVYFRDNVTLRYTTYLYNLSADYYTLAERYFIGLLIGGIVVSGACIIYGTIILILRKKR